MEAQVAQFLNRGMNQDISVSKASNEFAFRNYNIRITAIDANTLLSVTNEKMPINVKVIVDTENDIKGTYLGHAILNNYLVLFTKADDYDRIYRLEFKGNSFIGTILYKGDLQFDDVEAIETLVYYESEAIQKVYWVDGKNQPRFINIVSKTIKPDDDNQFNFTPNIDKFPNCTISKSYEKGGLFPSGVIQYFASYYNKYGTETGIVWASDLQYITEYNRGESPDKSVVCSFELNFTNLDTSFEYIRIYSICRTSYNGEVIAKLVTDKKISSNLSIIDTNLNSETIDSYSLFFLGGNEFIAETITQKDNTLFFGGITDSANIIAQEVKEVLEVTPNNNGEYISPWITFQNKIIGKVSEDSIDEEFQLNQSEKYIKTFKSGEIYRFAIQFQNSNATWTAPIWIGDAKCEVAPNVVEDNIVVANAIVNFEDNIKTTIAKYYKNYRLLIAEPTNADRSILAQGVVSPTVFNLKDRVDGNGAYAISSWIMRPRKGKALSDHMLSLGNNVTLVDTDEGKAFSFENLETCEIQNANNFMPIIGGELERDFKNTRINNYYIDNSIITFNSPELTNNESLFEDANLAFNIVGIIPIHDVKSDIEVFLDSQGLSNGAKVVKNFNDNETLINGNLFRDYQYVSEDSLQSLLDRKYAYYYLYLWNKSESIIGQTSDWELKDGTNHATLKHKTIANKNISLGTLYFDKNLWSNINVTPQVFNSDDIITKTLKSNEDTVYYQGNYEALLSNTAEYISNNEPNEDPSNPAYRVFFDGYTDYNSSVVTKNLYYKFKQYSPVSIKYKTTPHLVFSLGKNILPYIKDNNELPWEGNFRDFYNLVGTDLNSYSFLWSDDHISDTYIQKSIPNIWYWDKSYLYIGELSRNIDYNTLYGGTDNNAIEKINWIPASDTFDVNSSIDLTYGDTYYQRWDCLKTYPFTKEDQNSVVDITSFMVETHINLAGRYDKHKEVNDIINVDNTNFSQINNVYSQPNNFFSYNVLDEKFDNTKHLNQIVYSLNKIPTGDIDLWTSITLSTAFNLDGSKGNITKLLNFNDTIIAFQDKAISTINFNNRTALSTESGVPIEIANSGKVNGYSIISDTIGCQNKKSICKTPSGLYFIDDSSKSLFMFNKEGVTNISDSKGMSIWFKKYTTGKELITYDNLTHDVYISNEDYCLSYNNYMQSFISFYEYNDINALFNIDKESIILDSKDGKVISKLMFKGEYTPYYSMTYRVNPDPLEDKIFTNIEYIADFYVANSPDLPYSFGTTGHTQSPFNRLRVWNEYQEGVVEGTALKKKYPNFEKKFRTWRVDIPRDRINHRDRIRNPWIMLELSKSNAPNNRMVFHNLLVKYYK